MNTTNVTYRPREQGDPLKTAFAGFDFENGIPVAIPNDAVLETMYRKVVAKSAEGEDRTKAFEGQRLVLDALRTNPWFEVEGVSPAPVAARGRPPRPTTPEQYRSYALEWFGRALTTVALSKRWEDEQGLREKIGMSEDGDEIRYLTPFFEQRMDAIKAADKLAEKAKKDN